MLKYYKDYFGYENAEWLQLVILIASILFFVLLIYSVINKPKNYYKKNSELPLEDDSEEDKFKI
ncbi:CcoQ/FixQ family Cbb3-type cytochrome c oxidase assembly chaperone [Candidatus Ornithobacterium hominis]|uniref:cbb3-type cytochrome c oxidase subunit 3 n=1 Tax=Candidatus Ornithobacterium hominis TaxID=2497989 RepID=UPI0024BC7A81|nr:cbb3-type cytochrome c oxidase subunit 3 [Candidatus Ornithobacterium hominis]CAI9428775.1 CcoQ/FixQ family Cbb3-type cytochrome c oxidase assembly chaperone [Candidatus Ornithobacterium hominis]